MEEPDWGRREEELEIIKALDYQACRRWYQRIFAPNDAAGLNKKLSGSISNDDFKSYRDFTK